MNRELRARLAAIAEEAVIRFGPSEQLDILQEECCELAVEISHARRRRGNPQDLIEELADVIIMTRQAEFIVDSMALEEAITKKLDRLEKKLEGAR